MAQGLKKEEKSADNKQGKYNNTANQAADKGLNKKKSSPEMEEYSEDAFEEIDEDLPPNDDDGVSGDGVRPSRIGESHGITVSQSLGIDPSVDSLALEDYDHIESVDKVNLAGRP